MLTTNPKYKNAISLWLVGICLMIFGMVVVGGATRLTDSGLSMVEWNPISRILPPMSESAWDDVFTSYKKFPEFKILNSNMTLEEFKSIFYWEYSHRLLGRSIGMAFFVPFLIFWFKKAYSPKLKQKLLFAGMLGTSQGLMGWFMVKSGLVGMPHVSHYRLAAHLMLAIILFTYIFKIILDIQYFSKHNDKNIEFKINKITVSSLALICVIGLQIVYGAFLAGLKGGLFYNTFPKMGGNWIPPGILTSMNSIVDLTSDPVMVQLIHRYVGWTVVSMVFFIWILSRGLALTSNQKNALRGLILAVVAQFSLGVLTLVYAVPIGIALVHQAGAVVLLVAALYSALSFARVPTE